MITTKNIYGQEFRNGIISGMEEVYTAVASTYGPLGLNVIIEGDANRVRVTKDGATVAQSIHLSSNDKAKSIGAQLIQKAASQVADIAGDGTTTCTIITYHLTKMANKLIQMDENPIKIKKEIHFIIEELSKYLQDKSRPINYSNESEILKVATISANGDKIIGNHIKDSIMKVKTDGAITVEEGNSLETKVDLTEGLHFSSGHMSSYFINNANKGLTELEDAYILVYEKKLSNIKSIIKILEKVAQSGKSLLIIADDLDNTVLATLIMNQQRGLKVCAVKAPGYGDRKKDNLLDIAIATGAKLVTEDTGLNTYDVDTSVLGYAKKIIVSKNKTILIESACKAEDLENRKNEIKLLREKSTSEYEKEKLTERLAKLGNGVAIIKVGGSNEIERKELKDRVEDSLNATRAAIEQGILPGGGSALFYAAEFVLNQILKHSDNSLRKLVAKYLKEALRKPLTTILSNSGIENIDTIIHQLSNNKFGYGYNVLTEQFGDMIDELGIIDPTKVILTSLQNASDLAIIAITTKVGVLNIEENNSHKYS